VTEGQVVLSGGFLAGRIVETWTDRSRVQLITDTSSIIPVLLQQSRGQGLLRGDISGLVLTDIPADAEVSEGELILTSGLGGLLPPDIPIGVASSRVSSESEILQRIEVTSPVAFQQLEHVAIRIDQ